MAFVSFFLASSIVSVILGSAAGELSCKDDLGNSVDWFYASKLPKSKSLKNGFLVRSGISYGYVLSSEPEKTNWTMSLKGIDDPMSMFGNTLKELFQAPRSNNISHVLYNDQDPEGNSPSGKGHMKGVLAFDGQENGFWMVHSVPQYPDLAGETYDYPLSGTIYGQSFLCISFGNLTAISAIGTQFIYAQPNVYEYYLQEWVQKDVTEIWNSVVNSEVVKVAPWYHIIELESRNGSKFTYFAKHVKFNQDIYGDLVAPTLKTNLWVETWRHGTNKVPSVCRKYNVQNVKAVTINDFSYTNGQDHSKWAISPPSNSSTPLDYVCIGDINRMESQFRRGGGTVCLHSAQVNHVFDASTQDVAACGE